MESYWGGVRACLGRFFFQFVVMFADVCPCFAHTSAKFGGIFQARWTIFHALIQHLEKLDPGTIVFGFIALFASFLLNFRSSNLGRFRPGFLFCRSISCNILKGMQFCCFAKYMSGLHDNDIL